MTLRENKYYSVLIFLY